MTALKVARVLAEKRRENGAGHDVANGLIGEVDGVILRITHEALAGPRALTFRLADAGDNADDHKLVRIEGALKAELEFVARW